MNKIGLVLKLMEELDIKLRDLMLVNDAFDEQGKLSLEVYFGGKCLKDYNFFVKNDFIPEGVVIEQEIFPLSQEGAHYVGHKGDYSFCELKENGIKLPTKESLMKLVKHYKEYKAIAELFDLEPYECSVYQSPCNDDRHVHVLSFRTGSSFEYSIPMPFFEVKKA